MGHESIDRDLAGIGNRAQIAGDFDQVIQRGIVLHLINGGGIHRTGDRHQRSDVWNVDDVARLQADVF